MGWGKDAELNYKSDKKMCLQRSEQRRLKVTHGLMSLTCLLLDEELSYYRQLWKNSSSCRFFLIHTKVLCFVFWGTVHHVRHECHWSPGGRIIWGFDCSGLF